LLDQALGYIGGRWTGGGSGSTFPVINPTTGECLAEVPNMGAAETEAAILAAAAIMEPFSVETRRGWLTGIAGRLKEFRSELARLITLETGKALKDSLAEIDYSAAFFTHAARRLDVFAPRSLDGSIRDCRWMIHHRPTGVAGLITPWNFPIGMVVKKLSAALAAGCPSVFKPDEKTPLSAIAWWGLLEQEGLPDGLINLVIGDPEPIAETLCEDPQVRYLSFTGSTDVGRILAAQCAPHVKKLTLELGGNAPFIVFPDADVEAAADAFMPNKFRAGGQTCVCTNRIYVHSDIAKPFTDAVVERVRALRVGDPLDPDTDIGTLINRDGFDKVARHVRDALDRGAFRVVGEDPERPTGDWGAIYPPTVLTHVTPQMQICWEETFGPVAAIAEFEEEDSVIALANSTPFGLAAYVFTGDDTLAERVVSRLRFGHVGVNTGTGPTPEAPFGGVKQSGIGREGGEEGLLEFCESQTVAVREQD